MKKLLSVFLVVFLLIPVVSFAQNLTVLVENTSTSPYYGTLEFRVNGTGTLYDIQGHTMNVSVNSINGKVSPGESKAFTFNNCAYLLYQPGATITAYLPLYPEFRLTADLSGVGLSNGLTVTEEFNFFGTEAWGTISVSPAAFQQTIRFKVTPK